MKLFTVLPCLSILSLVSADIFSEAGARDPKFNPPAPKFSTKAVELTQSALFTQYVELEFLKQGIKNFTGNSYGDYPPKLAQTLKDIKAVVEYSNLLEIETLKANGAVPVQPCKYTFPVKTFGDFITVARLLFNIRIDYDAYLVAALAQSDPAVAIASAATGPTLARWDAFFRLANKFEVFEGVFSTLLNAQFLYNLDALFIVPGSCPSLPPHVYDLPLFTLSGGGSLTFPENFVVPKELSYVWDPKKIPAAKPGAKLYVAFFNQLGLPEYEPLTITAPGKGNSKRPTDIYGYTYLILVNATTATDIDGVKAFSLSKAFALAGPFKAS